MTTNDTTPVPDDDDIFRNDFKSEEVLSATYPMGYERWGSETQQAYQEHRNSVCVYLDRFYSNNRMDDLWNMVTSLHGMLKSIGYERSYGEEFSGDTTDGNMSMRVRYNDDDYNTSCTRAKIYIGEPELTRDELVRLCNELFEVRSADDVRRAKWRQSVADLITQGERLNVHADYRAMLTDMMERMSTNILEPPRARHVSHIDDPEMPF